MEELIFTLSASSWLKTYSTTTSSSRPPSSSVILFVIHGLMVSSLTLVISTWMQNHTLCSRNRSLLWTQKHSSQINHWSKKEINIQAKQIYNPPSHSNSPLSKMPASQNQYSYRIFWTNGEGPTLHTTIPALQSGMSTVSANNEATKSKKKKINTFFVKLSANLICLSSFFSLSLKRLSCSVDVPCTEK